jgi:hypothetical protein
VGRLLWYTKVQCRLNKSLPQVPIRCQINPIYALPSCIPNIITQWPKQNGPQTLKHMQEIKPQYNQSLSYKTMFRQFPVFIVTKLRRFYSRWIFITHKYSNNYSWLRLTALWAYWHSTSVKSTIAAHTFTCYSALHSCLTTVRDNLSQWTQDHKTERPTLFIVGPVAHERHSTSFNNQLTWESSQQPVTLDTITDINTVARKALTMSYLHRFISCTRVTMAMATNVFALLITPH